MLQAGVRAEAIEKAEEKLFSSVKRGAKDPQSYGSSIPVDVAPAATSRGVWEDMVSSRGCSSVDDKQAIQAADASLTAWRAQVVPRISSTDPGLRVPPAQAETVAMLALARPSGSSDEVDDHTASTPMRASVDVSVTAAAPFADDHGNVQPASEDPPQNRQWEDSRDPPQYTQSQGSCTGSHGYTLGVHAVHDTIVNALPVCNSSPPVAQIPIGHHVVDSRFVAD